MFPAILISLAAGLGLIFGMVGGLIAASPNFKAPPRKKVEIIPDLSQPTVPKNMDDFTNVAKELDAWRKELTEKRNEALQYDNELLKREEVLKAERQALDQERQKLDDLQKSIDGRLIKIKSTEAAKLDEMATLYATMKPDDAVQLMKALPKEEATKLMTRMPQKLQAKFIDLWLTSAASPDEKNQLLEVMEGMKSIVPDDGSDQSDQSANGSSAASPAAAPPGN